ncbi:MAG TPA: glycosyltransferase family 1 protein [Bacteroidales bacterium]|jgi:glycosyltransferase involved in cell wall biosynthesis|nr:glycosyltransferase family 1 protein [Bacteroidales bacterium]
MPDRHLNIVSFAIPYPPNYGGVIDVYHKLVALKKLEVKIHLHCFEYDRKPADELEKLCQSIHYYPRKTGLSSALSLKPYIVESRKSDELLKNLTANDYPIIFEGLHTCYYLPHPALSGRKLIYRESNIEHDYYRYLAKAERSPFVKLYMLAEAIKLSRYQKVLKHASAMLAVSQQDASYLHSKFPSQKVMYLPSFHGNQTVKSLTGSGSYALYHGNLTVAENIKAASYLVREVFNDLDIPLKIAGLNPPKSLKRLADQYGNVALIASPDEERMHQLVSEAHVNVMVTFQPTGLKLKLLNTLYNGRFVLVNPDMLIGTGLDPLCETASDALSLKASILHLFNETFDSGRIRQRETVLKEFYSDDDNAKKLLEVVFKD